MSGSLLAPVFRGGISKISLFVNKAAMQLPLPHGTGAFSNFIQAAKAPTKKVAAGGVALLTYYTTAIQLKDNYDDYEAKKITGLEASLGAGAAICGLVSGRSGTMIAGFFWAHASSTLTAGKYVVGGQKALSEKNNQLDFANSIIAKYATAISGPRGTALGIASGYGTTQLSATHGQIMKSIVGGIDIWPSLAHLGDRFAKNSEIDMCVLENL